MIIQVKRTCHIVTLPTYYASCAYALLASIVATTKDLTIYCKTTLVLRKLCGHVALKRIWLQLDSEYLAEIHNMYLKIMV